MYMSLFGEKYKPHRLDDFDFNLGLAQRLKGMTQIEHLHNSIFYGSTSSGKKTLIMALLVEMFGEEGYDRNIIKKKSSIKKNLDITLLQSNHHIEIDFKPYGINDRIVISDIIKKRCKSYNILTRNPRIIVIKNTDTISKLGQKMLLAMVEKSSKTCRFIFTAKNISGIIEPLKSRCFLHRCCVPTQKEIIGILCTIANKENITLTKKRAIEIINRSSLNNIANLANSIHILQMSYISLRYKAYHLKPIYFLQKLIKIIKTKNIMKIREYIFILTSKNINTSHIIIYLMNNLIQSVDSSKIKTQLLTCATKYQSLMIYGNKDPFYIEGFIANAVNIIEGANIPCI